MKRKIAPSLPNAEERFGRRVASALDASAAGLPHDISERLRVARQQALSRHRATPAMETQPMVVGAGAGVAALGGGNGGWWPRAVSLVPLLALIAGLIAIQIFGSDRFAHELAEIDVAILTDDLPPDAYADPGFAQFLKNRMNQLQQD